MITKHHFLKRVYILLFSIHVYKNNENSFKSYLNCFRFFFLDKFPYFYTFNIHSFVF